MSRFDPLRRQTLAVDARQALKYVEVFCPGLFSDSHSENIDGDIVGTLGLVKAAVKIMLSQLSLTLSMSASQNRTYQALHLPTVPVHLLPCLFS